MGDLAAAAALRSDVALIFLFPYSTQILSLSIGRVESLSMLTFVSKVRDDAFQSMHYFFHLRFSETD